MCASYILGIQRRKIALWAWMFKSLHRKKTGSRLRSSRTREEQSHPIHLGPAEPLKSWHVCHHPTTTLCWAGEQQQLGSALHVLLTLMSTMTRKQLHPHLGFRKLRLRDGAVSPNSQSKQVTESGFNPTLLILKLVYDLLFPIMMKATIIDPYLLHKVFVLLLPPIFPQVELTFPSCAPTVSSKISSLLLTVSSKISSTQGREHLWVTFHFMPDSSVNL